LTPHFGGTPRLINTPNHLTAVEPGLNQTELQSDYNAEKA